jgi:hypothetical protein
VAKCCLLHCSEQASDNVGGCGVVVWKSEESIAEGRLYSCPVGTSGRSALASWVNLGKMFKGEGRMKVRLR